MTAADPLPDEAWQRDHLDAAHVSGINAWITKENDSRESWMPFISPIHGGSDAKVVTVLRDPGPQTLISQMLSLFNADDTARTQIEAIRGAGLTPEVLTPWNAHPWVIPPTNALSPAQKDAGAQILPQLLAHTPAARVIILHGNDAVDTWWRASKVDADLETRHDLVVLRTYHPSRRGTSGSLADVAAKKAHIAATWRRAAQLISR